MHGVLRAQNGFTVPYGHSTPGGYFDTVFDRFGKKYSRDQITYHDKSTSFSALSAAGSAVGTAPAPHTTHGALSSPVVYTACSPGYFRIFLDDSCGMDLYATNPTEMARLNVLCQVLTDISNFIPSPCTTTGQKVNIVVGGGLTTGLGVATPFFNVPYSLPGQKWWTMPYG